MFTERLHGFWYCEVLLYRVLTKAHVPRVYILWHMKMVAIMFVKKFLDLLLGYEVSPVECSGSL